MRGTDTIKKTVVQVIKSLRDFIQHGYAALIKGNFHLNYDKILRYWVIGQGKRVLKPFKQSVGFQEKQAVATLNRNQMRLPWVIGKSLLAED